MSDYEFYKEEKLYRAVLPYEPFIKSDGTISSGVFKGKRDEFLSVDRQLYRSNGDAVSFIKSQKQGIIVSFLVSDCDKKDIRYRFTPVLDVEEQPDNPYHSEIFKNELNPRLSGSQAKYLAKICKKES